tara:strand:+ start:4094 stop:4327 length:234 start_codon:yes stop_codon:yes gene_type:complete
MAHLYTYIIISAKEVDYLDFAIVAEEKLTLIYNEYGTRTVIKYDTHELHYIFKYDYEGPYTLEELKAAQDPKEWPEQ